MRLRLQASLALTLITLCACSNRSEPRPAAPPDPAVTGGAPEQSGAGPARFEGPGEFLPHPEVQGWTIAGSPRYFDSSSLYSLIDGASDMYLEYGIQRLAAVDYHPTAGANRHERTLQIYLYDMGTPLNAFGRFSRAVDAEGDPAALGARRQAIGGGALIGSTQLSFWKGKHLVELTYMDESADADAESMGRIVREQLPQVARAIEARLPGTAELPAEVAALPRQGAIAAGAVYYVRSVRGFDSLAPLGSAVAAHYDAGGRFRLVRAVKATPAEAASALMQAKETLAGATRVPGLGDEAFSGRDPARGEVILARAGTVIVGAVDAGIDGAAAAPRASRIDALRRALGTR